MPSTRLRALRPSIAAMSAVLVLGAITVPVAAHDGTWKPKYSAIATPASIPAGTSTTSTMVIKELVTVEKGLGSVRVTSPAGLILTGGSAAVGSTSVPVVVTGSTATVESLSLRKAGQTLTLSLTGSVACGTAGTVTWKVNARTSKSYASSYGSDVAPDAATSSLSATVAPCALEFLRQPALAGTNQTITSVAADPAAASVAVRLLDGAGQPASQSGIPVSIVIKPGSGPSGATLGGVRSDLTNASGVAAFAPTIDTAGSGYRLDADAGAGIGGATSAGFAIAGVAVACSGSCTGSDAKAGTSATVAAQTTGGLLTLTVGMGQVDCNNAVNRYYQASSEPLVFDVTQGSGRTVITVRIAAAQVDRRVSKYQVCFSSPVSTFKNRYGSTIAPDAAGVLPDCPSGWGDRHARAKVKPAHGSGGGWTLPVGYQACTEKRWKDSAGNAFVRFSVPPGDPRAKI